MEYDQLAAEIAALVKKELSTALAPIFARLDALENAPAQNSAPPIINLSPKITVAQPSDHVERRVEFVRNSAGQLVGAISTVVPK